ncbi:MAG TPA: fumarylacetoacetase [Jatrophihabitans sp.]|jgi:fumarylacetoacetase|uniref:fumarylacetoacetase n=1 Tax=Jatrophihabitans sp. TaxID=1932789 RepID=UPI002F22BF93
MTRTWLGGAANEPDHPFGVSTLPYGVVVTGGQPQPAVRIGDSALLLRPATEALLPEHAGLFAGGNLDAFLAAGHDSWVDVRTAVTGWLTDDAHRELLEPLLIPLAGLPAVLPFSVADYVDFYASEHHARNVGQIFRPDSDSLLPNWKHLPVGYHGRAGTVVVSGADVRRPRGQRKGAEGVEFGPSKSLDIEAEVGFVVGVGSSQGRPAPITDFTRHVFGVVLLNDWSARDIQAWEYVPLGPFLGKSFATSISAWITPLAALETARAPAVPREPAPLPYLDDTGDSWNLDLSIEVRLNGELISRPPFAAMYWTGAQMMAHMTVNGASLRTGDLFGSGTVSGPERDQRGSLLELSWGGSQPFTLSDGFARSYLADGDEVVMTATAPGPEGARIGIAEVRGRITSALDGTG